MALVRVRGPLKQLAGDRSEHAIEGGSVGELLAELERAHPAAKGWILDERGVLRRHINVFVNGELGGQDTQVGRDDEVDVLPAISGGSLPRMLASVDGTIGPAEEARIPITDEGLTRGDGGFEVMRLYGGRPFALADHLARLDRTCAGLRLPYDDEALRAEIARAARAGGPGRRPAARGADPRRAPDPDHRADAGAAARRPAWRRSPTRRRACSTASRRSPTPATCSPAGSRASAGSTRRCW